MNFLYSKKYLIIKQLCSFLLFCSTSFLAQAQGIVGDGFGGNAWYQPGNIEVGRGNASAIINGQLYLWGSASSTYAATSNIPTASKVDYLGNPTTSNNSYAEPYAVPGFTDTKTVSMHRQVGVVKNDGTGWVWGPATGTDLSPFGNTPLQVITDAKHVSASFSHVAFVKNDGTVWSVGHNRYGAFGDGTNNTSATSTPVQMTGMTDAVRVMATGSSATGAIGNANLIYRAATFVIKSDGTLWVAGGGTTYTAENNNYTATQIPSILDVVDVTGGYYHTAILTGSGEVFSMGARYYAPHGNGEYQGATNAGYHRYPQKVAFPIGTPPIVAIESDPNSDITFAIDLEGKLWGWGYQNSTAFFGNGESISLQTPLICARNVVDLNYNDQGIAYMTRNNSYPEDERIWFTSNNNDPGGGLMALNENFTPSSAYNTGLGTNIWTVSDPNGFGLSGLGTITDNTGTPITSTTTEGTLDCNATVIIGNLVEGTSSDATLQVTIDISAAGSSVVNASGSGLSIKGGTHILNASGSGEQTFYIPLSYSGATLGNFTFEVVGIGTCMADLSTVTPTNVVNTIDVLPLGNLCVPITPVTLTK